MSETQRTLDPARTVALVDGLARVHGRLTTLVSEATATSTLTPSEGMALRVVAGAPEGLSQSRWGRQLGVSRQRAHALAEGLAARGLLTVERAGRASSVRVTASGAAALAGQVALIGAALGPRLAEVADSDDLLASLEALEDRLV